MSKINIAILQQIIPKYRVSFFNELYKKVEFELYTSNKGLESSIETVFDNINARINLVKNFIFINKINFQFLPFLKLLSKDLVIIEFNIRIISNIFLLLFRIFFKKKNILWTHGITDQMSSLSKSIRLFLMKRADAIIVYEVSGKDTLIELGISKNKIFFVKNSIDIKQILNFLDTSEYKFRITFIGRVIKEKNLSLLCDSYINILNKIKKSITLTIIGDGEELEKLKKNYNSSNRIEFIGKLNDEKKIAYYLNQTIFTVSPDYIGLAIIHSFCYSVPILVNKNPKVKHSPEIDLFHEYHNGWYFEGTQRTLENKLIECLSDKKKINEFGYNGLKKVKTEYGIEKMANNFFQAINSCLISHN